MTSPTAPANVVADPQKPWKAVAAAVVAFIGLLWANLAGHQADLGHMSVQDWLTVIVPTVVAFGATYAVPNPKTIKERA
jgi:hypothetical protein